MNKWIVVLLSACLSCATLIAQADEASPAIRGDIEAAGQAWELIEQGALVIDVRRPGEFEEGHIEGAVNVPHTDTQGLLNAIGDDRNRAVVLYCGSGRRAGIAQVVLEEMGYTGIFNGTGYSALEASKP